MTQVILQYIKYNTWSVKEAVQVYGDLYYNWVETTD